MTITRLKNHRTAIIKSVDKETVVISFVHHIFKTSVLPIAFAITPVRRTRVSNVGLCKLALYLSSTLLKSGFSE